MYAFSKIKPIMLSKSRLCSNADCFIRVYQYFLIVVRESDYVSQSYYWTVHHDIIIIHVFGILCSVFIIILLSLVHTLHILTVFFVFHNHPYFAGIMLDAFANLLCSNVCWHNWHTPNFSNAVNHSRLSINYCTYLCTYNTMKTVSQSF